MDFILIRRNFVGCLLFVILSFGILHAEIIDIEDFGAGLGDNDLTAINAAIQSAKAGDVVFIGQGIWNINGAAIKAKSGVSLKGAGIELTEIRHVGLIEEHAIIDIEGISDFSISDLTLNGQNNPLCTHGIDGSDTTNITIKAVRVQNLVESSEFGTFGVFFNGNAQNCTIHDCEFLNIGIDSVWGAAIQVSQLPNVPPSRNINITHNYIENTGRGGILLQKTLSSCVKENVIRGSGSSGDVGLGIELFDRCDFGIIQGNEVDHWISVDSSSYVAIRANLVRDDPTTGVQFAGVEIAGESANCIVADNNVGAGNQVGLSISNDGIKDNFLIVQNAFSSSQAVGAQVQGDQGGAHRLFIYRNVFEMIEQSTDAFINDTGHGFRINGNVQKVVFEDNEFSFNQGFGVQIRTDDFATLAVDQLTFRGNIILFNESEAIGITPDLIEDMQNVAWSPSNTLFGNQLDNELVDKGFENASDPRVRFRHSTQRIVRVGDRVQFRFGTRGSASKILWDLGNGCAITETNPVTTYDQPGTYNIRLVVWNESGRATIRECQVRVLERPQKHSKRGRK